MSIWADPADVRQVVEAELVERYLGDYAEAWSIGPGRGRCSQSSEIRAGAERGNLLVSVDEFGDAEYRSVVLTGIGCELVGVEGVLAFLAAVEARGWRSRASAVHVPWDGFPLDPVEFFDLLHAGSYRSRCKFEPFPMGNPHKPGERTTYTVSQPEKRGVERYVRVYDRRGPNRCELVLKGKHAAGAVAAMSKLSIGEVPKFWAGVLREFFDLTHSKDVHLQPVRRRLHPAWAEFVGEAERCRVVESREPKDVEAIATVSRAAAMGRRVFAAVLEAWGLDGERYLLDLIRHHAAGAEDPALVRELREKRGWYAKHRIGDVPVPAWSESVDIPF